MNVTFRVIRLLRRIMRMEADTSGGALMYIKASFVRNGFGQHYWDEHHEM
jgi:hypothetical protein